MKKICKVILAAAAVVALAVPAMAADKLIVKDAAGTGNVFKVTDGGIVGVNNNAPLYPVSVAVPGSASTSTLHFKHDGADNGGWLTSVGGNNFFISSGAVWKDGAWVQKDGSGNSIFFGSGGAGFRAFVNTGNMAVGGPVTNQIVGFVLDYSGNLTVNGGLQLNTQTSAQAQPTCDTTKRGYLWLIKGATGVKDAVQVCAKDAANAYAWRAIY